MMNTRSRLVIVAALAAPLIMASTAFASTAAMTSASTASLKGSIFAVRNKNTSMTGQKPQKPAVVGTVSSVNGSTITVTSKNGTVYSVDSLNATITEGFGNDVKHLATTDLKTGDKIIAFGQVSGTSVSATSIFDGVGTKINSTQTGDSKNLKNEKENHRAVDQTVGSIHPRIIGTVQSVNGSTFTLTTQNKTPVVFTVTTTSTSTFTKNGLGTNATTASLSDITTGARVMVSGTIDRTAKTVTATKVGVFAIKS